MPLHLVGETIDKSRGHYRARTGKLVLLMRTAPKHPSLAEGVIDDGMGEFRVNVSSIRQRFLEAFRLRSEHAASIDEDMREAIAERLVEESSQPAAAVVGGGTAEDVVRVEVGG